MNTARIDFRLALVTFTLATIAGCGSSTATKSNAANSGTPAISPKAQSSPSPASQTDGQVKFSPEGEEFTVMLPSTPTSKEVPVGENGEKMTVYSLQSPTEVITITSAPPDKNMTNPEQAITNVMAGFTDSMKKGGSDAEVVIDSSDEVSPSIQQRQFHIESNGKTRAIGRVYVTPRKTYLVLLVAPLESHAPTESHSLFTTWSFHE